MLMLDRDGTVVHDGVHEATMRETQLIPMITDVPPNPRPFDDMFSTWGAVLAQQIEALVYAELYTPLVSSLAAIEHELTRHMLG